LIRPSINLSLLYHLPTQVLEALIAAGADVNAQNGDGHTALFFAYNGLNQVG